MPLPGTVLCIDDSEKQLYHHLDSLLFQLTYFISIYFYICDIATNIFLGSNGAKITRIIQVQKFFFPDT